MASVMRNFIEIEGINSNCIPENVSAFKQFNIEETACLPITKPDIEQILKVIADVEIKSTRAIRTPVGTSLEGQVLTGWKLVIEGKVNQKVQYVADLPEQPSHAAHFSVPFSTFVVLPEDFVMGTPVTVTPFLEDIYVEQLDKRCIFKNITLLLAVEFC
ncbi:MULTISPECIES: DUF3794 domain-containing protein [Clostridium]|uniref:DUF3794 domain-containing protein n=1 Tax=Clostridium brassicae TaxID=2999072 RepID=A0ABT4DD60_9CLOT|nr:MULTISPECIES: DUF3794 domain-containing protein [Clostridium]MCY6958954.1 DUF3794 domain-containing protein [Clostridium brassicae]WMJ80620.1 DUF3794 domain-containing protein [Clostridium sp. MB40-C1]